MPLFWFDTETHLIKPGCAAPRMVCVSTASESGKTGLFDRASGLQLMKSVLEDKSVIVCGQNVFYDLGICCAEDPATFVPLVFKAFDDFRVRDTIIRQQLIDIASGNLKYRLDEETQTYVKTGYTLADLVLRLLGRVLPKEDTWRLKYALLDGVPIKDWPEDARKYAVDDAVATREVFLKQRDHVIAEGCADGVIPTEERATRDAWALWLMSAWGVRTDGEAVAKLKAELEAEQAEANVKLQGTGIIKRKSDGSWSRNMKEIYKRVEVGYVAQGLQVPMTSGKEPRVSTEYEALVDCKDEGLAILADAAGGAKLLNTYIPMLESGASVPINARFNVLVESNRTSCGKPNLQNLPRKSNSRTCFTARPGYVYSSVDYDTIELRALAQTCLDLVGQSAMAEALRAGEDLHLNLAADFMGISREEAAKRYAEGDSDVADQRQLCKCFHPDTEVLTRTGWKKIVALSLGEEVIQAIPSDTGVALEWIVPLEVFTKKHPSGKLVHLYNKGIDLRVTPDHRMLVYRQDGKPDVVMPSEFPAARAWASAGVVVGELEVDEQLLRLAVATQADGFYHGARVKFGFSKQRKVDRMRRLLSAWPDQWEYHEYSNGINGVSKTFSLLPELSTLVQDMLDEKRLPWNWLNLTQTLRTIVLDEAQHWDGSHQKHGTAFYYSSVLKQNADVMQALASTTGRKTRVREDVYTRDDGSTGIAYKVAIKDHWHTRGGNVESLEFDFTDEVACLSVPSSFVLVRDRGVPVICGQTANFGFPGGMSSDSYVDYIKGFGYHIDRGLAKRLHEQWFRAWPEMRAYFQLVGNLVGRAGEGTVVSPRSGFVRGGLTFTQLSNHYFQSLTATGAKDALWHVSRECYAVPSSPLWASRPVVFVHDEIIAELPEDRASAAAERQAQVMVEVMARWIPDIPIKAGPVLMRKWHKGAKAVRVNGKLVPSKPIEIEGKVKWVHDTGV